MKLIMAQSNLTLMGGDARILLKIAQHYDAKIYTAEYDPKSTFPAFRDLDVEVISRGTTRRLLPYGRVAQGLDYGLSFYNFRVRDDYDVINAHISPSHWVRNKNPHVLWYCHTPPRDVYDLYRFRLSLKRAHQRPVYALGAAGVRILDQRVVKRIEGIIANSENTNGRIKQYYGRSDATVLPGGIEYEKFGASDERKYFLYPSRFSPNKRQEYAIKAFREFRKMKKGYRLVLCGPVSKDRAFRDYYDRIRALAADAHDVMILENVSENKFRQLMASSTAVLYPPMNEDYGLVPLEAMASHKPVIAVDEGGPAMTVNDGKTGFLVESEEEMARKMLYVAEHPKVAEQMGKSGRTEVERNYSWKAFFRVFDREARKVASADA